MADCDDNLTEASTVAQVSQDPPIHPNPPQLQHLQNMLQQRKAICKNSLTYAVIALETSNARST